MALARREALQMAVVKWHLTGKPCCIQFQRQGKDDRLSPPPSTASVEWCWTRVVVSLSQMCTIALSYPGLVGVGVAQQEKGLALGLMTVEGKNGGSLKVIWLACWIVSTFLTSL